MDISLKSRKYHQRDVRRTTNEIVRLIVYQGLGREFHACSFERLYGIMKRKDKHEPLTKPKFRVLLTQVNNEMDEYGFWKVHVDFDQQIIKVK